MPHCGPDISVAPQIVAPPPLVASPASTSVASIIVSLRSPGGWGLAKPCHTPLALREQCVPEGWGSCSMLICWSDKCLINNQMTRPGREEKEEDYLKVV